MVNCLFSIRKQIVYGSSIKGKQIHYPADYGLMMMAKGRQMSCFCVSQCKTLNDLHHSNPLNLSRLRRKRKM